jgi:multidrug efflux pump subunit AcrA (membrane-fusion protein)
MADARRVRGRRRGRPAVVWSAIGVVVCLAAGGAAWAALQPQSPSYRTAAAQKADVTQTAALAGTVASATRADRAFQVSGTVASVGVKVGDQVTAGQTLATLDTSVLDDAVTQSQQAVSTAQQTLNDDLASQTASASTTTTTTTASGATDASSDGLALGTFVAAAAPGGATDLGTLEANVTAAQTTLVNDVTAVANAVTSAGTNADCTKFLALDSTKLTATPDPADDTQFDLATAQAELKACQSAITDAIGSQAISTLQTTLTGDEQALDNAVTALVNAAKAAASATPTPSPSASSPAQGSGGQPTQGGGAGSSGGGAGGSSGGGAGGATGGSGDTGGAGVAGGTGATGGRSGGGSGGAGAGAGAGSGSGSGSGSKSGSGSSSGKSSGKTSTPATAEQIVADQASLAAAQANLAVAQQNVGLATLTSPIAGTVAAVGVSAGSSVSAQSTSQVISVIGGDGWVVDTAVTATAIGPLKVGQSATVNVSGVSGALTGKVTAIGFLNTATDSSTPSYDVTLALSGSGAGLLNGASARLTVNVDKASDVLTVPSSAVHLGTGNTYSVDVVSDGKQSARQIKVGAIGADRTEVTSGLSAGDRVILADLSSTVSSDSTQTGAGGRTGGLGGLTGGGAQRLPGGAGGFGGGGFGRAGG